MKKVLIIKKIHDSGIKLLDSRKDFSYEIVENLETSFLINKVQDCDAMTLRTSKLGSDLINVANKLKIISRHGVGYDNVDLESAKSKGIIVCNVPDYGTNDVADHTMALLLTLSRAINEYNEQIRKNKSWEWNSVGDLKRLNGLTIGILGLGRIGTAVAMRACSFGLNVSFYDPYLPLGVEKVFGYKRY